MLIDTARDHRLRQMHAPVQRENDVTLSQQQQAMRVHCRGHAIDLSIGNIEAKFIL